MSFVANERPPTVGAAELRESLEQVLSQHFGRPCAIAQLKRRVFGNASSFAIEELDVELERGDSMMMLLKNLGRDALVGSAQHAKPAFLHNPLREIETYRRILAAAHMGTATCYGAVIEPERNRYWLFLERVGGIELHLEGDLAVWRQVAAWLARFHAAFAGRVDEWSPGIPLLVHDRVYYRRWLGRAQEIVRGNCGGAAAALAFANLAAGYDRVIDRLLALPTTLVHGEFYAANVLVENGGSDLRVCPVDWEMAAVGPGLIDLAALVAGKWTEESQESMARAYFLALKESGIETFAWDEFLVALDCCRLHQAVQWLGWSSTWTPPPTQAQDWLGEALRLAGKLMG